MLQQLLVLWSPLAVLGETVRDEAPQLGGEPGAQTGRVVAQDAGQNFKVSLTVFIGELPRRALHQRYPETPHIRSDVVVRPRGVWGFNPLRGHISSTTGTTGLSFRVH